jgi:hypothetical protein
MTYDQLIAFYGSQQKAADAIGVWQSAISPWKKSGIPYGRQLEYEKLTNGALVAEKRTPTNKRSGIDRRRNRRNPNTTI